MMSDKIPRKPFNGRATLTLHETPVTEYDKLKTVQMSCRVRAELEGGRDDKYKLYLQVFDNGTPEEYIQLRLKFEEVRRQNVVDEPEDRVATVRAVMKGDSLETFNTSLIQQQEQAAEDVEEEGRNRTGGINAQDG